VDVVKAGRNIGELATSQKTISPVKTKGFYGWIALAGAALGAFVGGGIFFYSYGVFLPVMVDEFGWSRAVVALGMSLGTIAFGLPSPLVGMTVSRFGARRNLIIGNLVGAIGLACMFFAQDVWHVYFFYILAGVGCCFGGVIPATSVASNWFIKKRSLAIGVIMACAALGGFIFPLLATSLMTSIGWRMAWVVLAGILFLIGSLLGSLVLVRNKPEEMGQLPDGVVAKPASATRPGRPASGMAKEPPKWPLKQVLSQPTIWLIIAFSIAAGFASGSIMGHQVAYMRDLGSSPMLAASTLSIIAACSIIGSLGFGALAMKYNIRYLLCITFIIRLVSLVLLLTSTNINLIFLYAILFGISNGALGTALFTVVGSYYGRSNFARIQGVVYAFSITLQAAGPLVAGALYDNLGTYTPAFIIAVVVTFIGLVCAFLARPPKLPEQKESVA
jgi:MFS family permease